MITNNQPTAQEIAAGLSAEEWAALESIALAKGGYPNHIFWELEHKDLVIRNHTNNYSSRDCITKDGLAVLATRETPVGEQSKLWGTFNPVTISAPAIDEWATKQPVSATAAGNGLELAEVYHCFDDEMTAELHWYGMRREEITKLDVKLWENHKTIMDTLGTDLRNRLAATETQLSALRDHNAQLRGLCARAADLLEDLQPRWSELNQGAIDDLRQAAEGEENRE